MLFIHKLQNFIIIIQEIVVHLEKAHIWKLYM